MAQLSGAWLQSGRLSVKVNPSVTELYIVEVAKQTWSHYQGRQEAEFTLELTFDGD